MPADRRIAIVFVFMFAVAAITGLSRAEDPGANGPSQHNGVPKAYPEERYVPVWKKSPFMREAAPAAEQARKSFARDYFLSGYVESGDETIAYLKNQKSGESIRLTTKGGHPEFRLVSLQKHRDHSKVTVTVEHGPEKDDIGYDPAAFAQPASPGQGSPTPTQSPALANRPVGIAPSQTGEPADQPTGPYLNPAAERLRQQPQQKAQSSASPSSATQSAAEPTAEGRRRRTLPEPLRIE